MMLAALFYPPIYWGLEDCLLSGQHFVAIDDIDASAHHV